LTAFSRYDAATVAAGFADSAPTGRAGETKECFSNG